MIHHSFEANIKECVCQMIKFVIQASLLQPDPELDNRSADVPRNGAAGTFPLSLTLDLRYTSSQYTF